MDLKGIKRSKALIAECVCTRMPKTLGMNLENETRHKILGDIQYQHD